MMPKLMYVYVKNIGRKIINQEVNFSGSHKIKFEENVLSIDKLNDEAMDKRMNFWGNKVNSCTLLVGKNGVGKTSILDLLGLNEKTKNSHFPRGKYFMVYQLDRENSYYFSGTMVKEIRNFKNAEKGMKNFAFKKNDDCFDIDLGTKFNSINTYYVRSEAKLSWTQKTKIHRGGNIKALKYSYPKAKFNDVLSLISNFSVVENLNRVIRVEQKIKYLNNPRYLAFIYQANLNEIDHDMNNFLFLSTEYYNKNVELSKIYTREKQDRFFGKADFRKEYFILRLLEKVTIKHLATNMDSEILSDYEKYILLEEILQIREKSNYFMLNTDYLNVGINNYYELNFTGRIINEKIDYLLSLLNHFNKKIKGNNLRVNMNDVYELFKSLPEEFFGDKNYLKIPGQELEYYNQISYLQEFHANFVKFTFENFSEGELVFLDLFATVLNALTHSKNEDLILILDEPDINLHPEWSRKLLDNLIDFIDKNKKNGSVQIIISTHSPFIVTDFPKENIYTFNKTQKGNIKIQNPEFGFAANIYDLISSTFFMSAPVGEFATKKINQAKENYGTLESKDIIEKIDDVFLKNLIKEGLNRSDKDKQK